MATTTNYGWETPDDTDLVKDGAAAIRILGSSVDTTTKNLNPQTTTGALAYRSATANVNTALAIGSTGQVLTVAGGVPSWATPAGGGKVLQVVSSNSFSSVSIATTTFTDTAITLNITPTLATSKVLVLVMGNTHTNGVDTVSYARLLRDATTLITNDQWSGVVVTGASATNMQLDATGIFSYLDSPATTSATTYKVQSKIATTGTGKRVEWNYAGSTSSITLMEIGI